MRFLSICCLSLFAACTGNTERDRPKAPEVPAAAGNPAAEDADCNLSTPLVPGIPGSPGHLIKSTRNPNGDSELAVLMRQFVDDLREVQPLLAAGAKVKPLFPAHRKMRCAWPTKPDERNPNFDARAVGYLAAVRAFDDKPGKATYNAIIDGCVHCHGQSCGGPLEFIDSMRW